MNLSLVEIQVFALTFARIAGLLGQASFYSFRNIPVAARAGIAFMSTLLLWFVLPIPDTLPDSVIIFFLALIQEYLIGRLMGFVSFIIVRAVIAAGDLMGMQMGLSSANLFDPVHGVQTNVVSRLFDQTALLFLLVINGHIMIFTALEKSFHLIPVYSAVNLPVSMPHLIDLGSTMWEIAVRFAAPVILAIFLLDFAFGTISRVAPQVNVFMLGFQIKPSLGLLTFYLMMPLLIWRIIDLMQTILSRTIDLLGYMTLPG